MLAGRYQLRQWMERRKLNGRETAKLLGLHFTVLSNYVTGKRQPGRENAIIIERHTGIPVEAWEPTIVGKSTYRPAKRTRNGKIGKEKSVNA